MLLLLLLIEGWGRLMVDSVLVVYRCVFWCVLLVYWCVLVVFGCVWLCLVVFGCVSERVDLASCVQTQHCALVFGLEFGLCFGSVSSSVLTRLVFGCH